jgi:hypothetical protein
MNAGQPAVPLERFADLAQKHRLAAVRPESTAQARDGIWITGVEMLDAGRPSDRFPTGSSAVVRIGYETSHPIDSPGFAVDINRADGVHCFGIGMWSDQFEMGHVNGRGFVDLEISPLTLGPGFYNVSVGIHRRGGIGATGGLGLYDLLEFAYPFAMSSERGDLGVVCLEHQWRHVHASDALSDSTTLAVTLQPQVRPRRTLKEVAVQ